MKRFRLGIWGCVGLTALVALVPVLRGRDQKPEPASVATPHWPAWRGPSGQGYSDDARVPLTWNATENLLWKSRLPGRGNSSPIVWGDRVFLTAASESGRERFLLCLAVKDGQMLWQQKVADDQDPGRSHQWNGFASASCTTDGSRVYAFFGTPGLFCYDFAGRQLWKHSFGTFTSETGWGTAASPFLYRDLVIQNCDNDGSRALPPGQKAGAAAPMALVALDKLTGKLRWQTNRNQGQGFSTPVLIPTPQGRVDLVLNGPLGVWAYDPDTGKEIWHRNRIDKNGRDQAKFGEPIPAFDRDILFAPSGRPGPCQAIRLGGAGDITQSNLVWEEVRKGHRDVASPILWDGLLYIADNKGMLTCHDARTGRVVYLDRLGPAHVLASPLVIRGKLLFVLDDGLTVVVEPGRRFQITGKNRLGDGKQLDFAASPAVVAGRLFLRSQSHLYCIGEKQ
jgi:outer membrane protein assembly factor BamB